MVFHTLPVQPIVYYDHHIVAHYINVCPYHDNNHTYDNVQRVHMADDRAHNLISYYDPDNICIVYSYYSTAYHCTAYYSTAAAAVATCNLVAHLHNGVANVPHGWTDGKAYSDSRPPAWKLQSWL